MSVAFADSSFYVAILIARDSNHAAAKRVAESWTGSVVTTEYVLTEVANHLSGTSQHREQFGRLLADLVADTNTLIVESSPEVWRGGVNLYLHRPDKEWSLTDCISFIIMEERGLKDSLTADHHFEQAGFIRLLQTDD
jgi:predicted nucleic acid-binding protein